MQYKVSSVLNLSELSGVYLFKDEQKNILYIGKAKNLKKRVSSYFTAKKKDGKIASLVPQIKFIETIPVPSEFEALLLEAKLIKKKRPKYNSILKDDKHYIYIKITKEKFPRIYLSRRLDYPKASIFGPFPSASIVKDVIAFIRTIFPFCTQSPRVKKPCFYTHLGLCNPCPGQIVKFENSRLVKYQKQYLQNIKNIKMLLGGQTKTIEKYLRKKMNKFSVLQEYEKAALFRDKLHNLEYLVYHFKPVGRYLEDHLFLKKNWRAEAHELLVILKEFYPNLSSLKKIECYDVSNISGKLATGSMVTFIHGQPYKKLYRRFRIKSIKKANDVAMLNEIIQRRLKHAEWSLPDLFVIDGGKTQFATFQKVLADLSLCLPVVALAKRYEELVVPKNSSFAKLKLPKNSKALQLVQRIRDEAHRFAHKYHESLRLKYLLGRVGKKN